ncbi:MAG: nucleotide sugar dehydrogenase [Candidatus Margulisiibacteriota bacterium]
MFKNDICVIGGCGHVGLPLALAFADKGVNVTVHDMNDSAVAMVNEGKMPFLEAGAEEILKRVINKTLKVANDPVYISESKFVIVVIGTPVDEHLNPKFNAINKFFQVLMPHFKDNQHIILRSTVFPGTTEKIRQLLDKNNKKVKLTFCPERIAEGKAMEELCALPQVVSGFDQKSIDEASELFKNLTNDIVPVTPIEAELTKLFTNSWRYIQFATANQFYILANQHGVDFYKIYNAMRYKYPRTEGFPGPGFSAGPCLLKDTMQIAAFSNNNFFLGHAAMLINEGLPNYIVQKLKEKNDLKGKKVGILGMAFKGNNDDIRDSLSYKLKKILEIEAEEVLCTDVYVKGENIKPLDEVLKQADILVLGAPHREYKTIECRDNQVMIDIWNYYGKGGLF